MKIEINQELRIKNLLACRKKIPQEKIRTEIINIESFMEKRSIMKQGPVITSVYALGVEDGNEVIDLEILVPVDRGFSSENGYSFRDEFFLQRALCLKFRDKPELLENAYGTIHAYMEAHGLKPSTPMYNVYINNNINGAHPERTDIDIYLGVQPLE